MRNRWFAMASLLVIAVMLAACGGNTASNKNATATIEAGGVPATPKTVASAATTAPAAASTTAASASTPAAGAATTAPAAAAGGGGGNVVNVAENDFAIMLDNSTVSAGTVTFNIKNAGPSPHNFMIGGKMSETIEMGKTTTLKVDLKAGPQKYICNIAGHEQLGMVGTLTVK